MPKLECFERLLHVKGREVTLDESCNRAQAAIDGSWAEFQARKLDNKPNRRYDSDRLNQCKIARVFPATTVKGRKSMCDGKAKRAVDDQNKAHRLRR